MKIAIRAGHNFECPGFSMMLNETIESRKIKDSAIKYLIDFSHDVLDITPENMNPYDDEAIPVDIANEWGADLFLSIHFNRAKAPLGETNNYTEYNGPLGSICWVYQYDTPAYDIGEVILDTLCTTGLCKRATRTKRFYELRETKMPAIRVEICFVEATEDVAIYNFVGSDKIGMLLAKAINEQTIIS